MKYKASMICAAFMRVDCSLEIGIRHASQKNITPCYDFRVLYEFCGSG